MFDRATQTLYSLALLPIAQQSGDINSFGFRPGVSTMDALQTLFYALRNKPIPRMVYEADIKGFFDNISHE
jgi:RNA-directed DNA polymerase